MITESKEELRVVIAVTESMNDRSEVGCLLSGFGEAEEPPIDKERWMKRRYYSEVLKKALSPSKLGKLLAAIRWKRLIIR